MQIWSRIKDLRKPSVGLLGMVVTAVITLLINDLLGDPVNSLLHGQRVGLGDQVGAIEKAADANGAYGQFHEADLRGPGLRSIFIDSSRSGDVDRRNAARSDEMQIWDLNGSGGDQRFVERWSFEPQAIGLYPGIPWNFHLRSISDVRNDGEQEIIGWLQPQTSAHPPQIPVMIRWDPEFSHYTVVPLVNRRPTLRPAPSASWAQPYQLLDSQAVKLIDPSSGVRVTGYSAQYFAIVGTTLGVEIVVAYPSAGRPLGSRLRYQLVGFSLDFGHLAAGESQDESCIGQPGPVFEYASLQDLTPSALVAAWRRMSGCVD